MNYHLNRFVINVSKDKEKTSTDQSDIDFFIQPDPRKVILGTVRLTNGEPVPCAVVEIFKLKNASDNAETTSDLEPIGHAITDDCGQFVLGPVYPGDKIILKIFYLDSLANEFKYDTDIAKSTLAPGDYNP